MRLAQRDPDLALVEEMLAPPPLDDARRSLEYWQERRRRLPVYQRSARREAREMTIRWEGRVRQAELLRFEATLAGRVLKAVGLARLYGWLLPLRKGHFLELAWAVTPRRLKLVAGGLVAAWLVFSVLAVTALAAVVFRLG
ncbi:MAG TPA: hypothetical protein VFK62_09585 [Gaiellaceae bacterium]|nr:hypothetical protein [Gaiellaceae bacterium]